MPSCSTPTHQVALLEWRVWPAREWPRRTALAIVIIAGLGVASALLLQSSTAAGVAIGAMLLANIRFFLPSSYRVDTESITLTGMFGTRSLALSSIRFRRFDRFGGLLAERLRPGPFASLRGLPVLFPRHDGELLAKELGRCLTSHSTIETTP